MSVAIYPDVLGGSPPVAPEYDIRPVLPFNNSTYRAVMSTEFENGIEQRRLLWGGERKAVELTYNHISFANANKLKKFYSNRKGSYERFSFFYPHSETYEKELVGVMHDPTIPILSLPSYGATEGLRTLYADNVALIEGIGWTFNAGVSTEDTATLIGLSLLLPPGTIFHFSFTGRLKINAKFSQNP